MENHDVDAAVFGGGRLVGTFDGVEVALGENLELVGGDAERGQVLFDGVGAAVAEAEVILGGALPVAVAFEEETGGGVGVDVGLGGVELGTLGGLDAGLVEVEIDGGTGEGGAVAVGGTAGAGAETAVRIGEGAVVKAADILAGEAVRTENGGGRIGALGLLGAAGSDDRSGDDDKTEFLDGAEVHVRTMKMQGEVDLIGHSFCVARYLTTSLQTVPHTPPSAWFLFDNGSLRAESTISLRRLAEGLSAKSGLPVQAVSLLHSSNIPAEALGGEPARLLEPSLAAFFDQNPEGEATLLPLFFGPSAALTEYVPARLAALRQRFPRARTRLAPWLVDGGDDDNRIAAVIADQVRATGRALGWIRPKVVMVDHGSPQAGVARVRDHLGDQVRAILGDEIERLAVASMERREGDAYAFNEPLLAAALRTPPFDQGNVVIALQFLSPGRHAGPGGDIAVICSAAETERPSLRTQMTEPIAADARLLDVLAERLARARPA